MNTIETMPTVKRINVEQFGVIVKKFQERIGESPDVREADVNYGAWLALYIVENYEIRMPDTFAEVFDNMRESGI